MQITNHRLEGTDLFTSPNQGEVITPDTIILHYTASSTAQSAIDIFMDETKKVSAHIIVGLDGSLTQLVIRGLYQQGPDQCIMMRIVMGNLPNEFEFKVKI